MSHAKKLLFSMTRTSLNNQSCDIIYTAFTVAMFVWLNELLTVGVFVS